MFNGPAFHTRNVSAKTEDAMSLSSGMTKDSKSIGQDGPAQQLVQQIIREHSLVKEVWQQYRDSNDVSMKLNLGRTIMQEIVQHAGREEIALYPAFRDIPSLASEVDKAKAEHLQVTVDLSQLDQMKTADAKYDALLQKIMTELVEHIADEESRLLPLFIRDCDPSKAAKILSAYQNATVTTRPHPMAPHEGLPARMAQAASVPLDAAMNMARGLPTDAHDARK